MLLLVGLLLTVSVQAEQGSRALYIIFDGSNSMWGELPDKSRKIAVAKDVFNKLDASLFAGKDVALRLYGHRRAGDCDDIELAVPFTPAKDAVGRIAERINAVSPRGKTPITRSLKAALKDFSGRSGDILLISDGIETCDADPCDLVRGWRDSDIDIRVHVVGLGLTELARSAMQCIAEASGTKYHDANSARDLGDAIAQAANSTPPEPAEPRPRSPIPGSEFRLLGEDESGNYLPLSGTLTPASGEPITVRSNTRYVIDGGVYMLAVGVPTLNDEVYKAVTRQIEVADVGTTRLVVVVPRPPRVTTRFIAEGKEVRGPLVTAYSENKKLFGIRPNEEHFIMPGTYEFRAKLNQDNDLKITRTIVDGQDSELLFEAVKTVRVKFAVRPEGRNKVLRQHQQLLQDGKVAYKIHWNNGADVRPGLYTLRSAHPLTPYEFGSVTVGTADKQVIDLVVPFAIARLRYAFNTEAPSKDLRCWIVHLDENGKRIASSKALTCDGRDIVLQAGRYRVRPWTHLGTFHPVEFDAVIGQPVDVSVPEI